MQPQGKAHTQQIRDATWTLECFQGEHDKALAAWRKHLRMSSEKLQDVKRAEQGIAACRAKLKELGGAVSTRYLLVHEDELVWTRSGHRPAIYDSVDKAREYQSYHTTDYVRDDQGGLVRGETVTAQIMELTITDGVPNVRMIE